MSDLQNKDKDFIENVWKKTRYLEYIKTVDEKNKKQALSLRKRKLKNLLTFYLGLVLIIIPLLVIGNITGEFASALLGFYVMSFALYYEYTFS